MKLLLTFFILLLLQGCSTLSVQPQQAMLAGDTPSQWQLKGRIGVVSHDKVQNFGFNIKFKEQVFNLTLTGTLGLGQINIVSNNDGLYIDGHPSSQDLKQLMIKEFGWHFPVRNLGNIVFKHRLNTESEWRLTITKFGSYQGVSVAKVVKLKHSTQAIKIKLLFQKILPTLD
jgi:hypothetical protein